MSFEHIKPADIEKTSMSVIEKELNEMALCLEEENKAVIKRVIHTTADFNYVKNLYFSKDALKKCALSLKGNTIITDTNMAKSGISRVALNKLGCDTVCFMADEEVAKKAKELGVTRAVVSMEKAAELFPNGIFAVGNAPTALIKLCDLMENGLRPSLIIGVPVGFVNVVESKEMLIETCEKYGVPVIAARGRKGGSTVAAAICNALLYLAADLISPDKRWW